MLFSFPLHVLVLFCLKINCFLFFSLLLTNLFDASFGVEFDFAIVEEREVDSLAPNLQYVKEEVKEESDTTEIIDGIPVTAPIYQGAGVEEKVSFSDCVKEENVKEENEKNSESGEFEDFIIKEEVGSGGCALNKENGKTEIVFEEYDSGPLDLETKMKEENKMQSKCERFEVLIIKKDPDDEIKTGAYAANENIFCERRIPAEKISERKESLDIEGKKILHKCDKCGKSFSRKYYLSHHILTHTEEKLHKCEKCGKSFTRKFNLSQHIITHTGEKIHHCEECGKSFSLKNNLSKHILRHTGEKAHKCEKCGKSFSLRSYLSKHILIHSGTKPHNCDKCGKTFFQKCDLSRHVLIHTGEKLHNCEKCGKSFSLKHNLSNHILTHTGEKPHNCEKCGKSFSRNSDLSRHVLTHTGKKPHNCEKCGKSFSLKKNLSKHIFTQHTKGKSKY